MSPSPICFPFSRPFARRSPPLTASCFRLTQSPASLISSKSRRIPGTVSSPSSFFSCMAPRNWYSVTRLKSLRISTLSTASGAWNAVIMFFTFPIVSLSSFNPRRIFTAFSAVIWRRKPAHLWDLSAGSAAMPAQHSFNGSLELLLSSSRSNTSVNPGVTYSAIPVASTIQIFSG